MQQRILVTPALQGHHLVILFQHYVLFRVVEEKCQVAVERGDAAGGLYAGRLAYVVDKALHGGMVGGIDALH